MISIVTPVYNEDGNVVYFHDEVTKVMQTLDMDLSLIHISEPTRPMRLSRMPSSA